MGVTGLDEPSSTVGSVTVGTAGAVVLVVATGVDEPMSAVGSVTVGAMGTVELVVGATGTVVVVVGATGAVEEAMRKSGIATGAGTGFVGEGGGPHSQTVEIRDEKYLQPLSVPFLPSFSNRPHDRVA